jgi:hypothetical protein
MELKIDDHDPTFFPGRRLRARVVRGKVWHFHGNFEDWPLPIMLLGFFSPPNLFDDPGVEHRDLTSRTA